MRQSHDTLIEHIERLEKEREHTMGIVRNQERLLQRSKAHEALLLTQTKAMQTLSLAVFGVLEVKQIYAFLCESLVYQLGWDSAYVVHLHGTQISILASFGNTEKQLGHIHDYAGVDITFTEAYGHKQALTSFYSTDQSASLALRTLFGAEDVAALPVQSGDTLYGYLVTCAKPLEQRLRGEDEMHFLASMAAQIGSAVQNSKSFHSLEAQNLKLRQIDELKDSFLSITSHQLRTPLSIVKWILSILQTDPLLTDHERQQELVDQAYESNERLIHVVNDLLNVSRIQDGRLPYTPQPTDLAIMLGDLVESIKRMCANRHITLVHELATDIPNLQVDPILFKEALENLLDNAVEYNQPHGTIAVRLYHRDQAAYIDIENTGFGVSEDDQKRIFQQFYRSAEAVQIQPNGNGLGLYLTRAIVREHGGDVTCVSKNGLTTFTVKLLLPTH